MIELSKQFVAATDEVWRLQRGDDPECSFFQEMADHGHYGGKPGHSRQGIYVCAPSGKFLASINSTNPDRVLAMMGEALKNWAELPNDERALAKDSKIKPAHRWEDSYPEDGLVLNMTTRDLPDCADPEDTCAAKWNQDPVWFSKSEARQWLPADLDSVDLSSNEHELPRSLVKRLAGLHLVDTVKGQSDTFSDRDFKELSIRVKVLKREGDQVEFRITGQVHSDASRETRRTSPHGVKTQMLGSGTYDLNEERFTKFEMVAIGTRWGRTRFNGRRWDANESNVGFVFEIADPSVPRIAPAFIHRYEADWVIRPK